MTQSVITIQQQDRTCGTCTVCCEGWLKGNIYGYEMFPGRPCHFKGTNNCTIYNDRPDIPCKKFFCQWLIDYTVPEWLKPNIAKVLITKHSVGDEEAVSIYEAGDILNVNILNYFFLEYIAGKIKNLRYQVNGQWYYVGSDNFIKTANLIDSIKK